MLKTEGNQFMLDGKPVQILSGAIHYFRVVPEHWKDRLLKLKACGLNTVETYLPWNLHEPKKGEFHFSGLADVEAFVELAGRLGLYVILRPSPYICAEWEFGGLPAWLLKDKNMELRCSNEEFMKHVSDYYDELIPRLAKYQYSLGGQVIAFQIENEYGAYGNDKQYLSFLKHALMDRGITSLLFTSDGPEMIEAGSLPDVLTTVNFGSKPTEAFEKVENFKADHPKMCMEFWIGWFDHWGGEHHTRSGTDVAETLRQMLESGASINFYMFHGGTNFGCMNGANHYEEYTPTITSYDYDALLTESGEITEKYRLVQQVIKDYAEVPDVKIDQPPAHGYGQVTMEEVCSLFDTLEAVYEKKIHSHPLSMEQLGQNYGLTVYKTILPFNGTFEMDTAPIRDRAYIYLNGKLTNIIYRNDKEKTIQLMANQEENVLEIVVENMGRVNYGKHLKDSKGIISPLWINNQFVSDWEIYSIELDDMSLNGAGCTETRYPKFYRGLLQADVCRDTFISMEGWKKGYVFINGFNLGRYWEEGPQKTLYVPGPCLKEGENEIIILELEGTETEVITLKEQANLG
ncbi:MAG: beta-galactosidase family protein [Lysinibacillus sp.]